MLKSFDFFWGGGKYLSPYCIFLASLKSKKNIVHVLNKTRSGQ